VKIQVTGLGLIFHCKSSRWYRRGR